MDIITKNTSIKESIEILNNHGISTKLYGWEIIIGMLLYDCDYIEVHGYGHNAYFIKKWRNNNAIYKKLERVK